MNKLAIKQTLKIETNNLNAYSTGLLQGKAYRALNAALVKTLTPHDLSIPEWKLLGQLCDHGSMKLADLAQRLDVEPPLVTALIDTLEAKKLLTRTLHTTDKRAKIITITPDGEKIIVQLEPYVKLAMAALLQGVTREQLHTYIFVLETIVTNAS